MNRNWSLKPLISLAKHMKSVVSIQKLQACEPRKTTFASHFLSFSEKGNTKGRECFSVPDQCDGRICSITCTIDQTEQRMKEPSLQGKKAIKKGKETNDYTLSKYHNSPTAFSWENICSCTAELRNE